MTQTSLPGTQDYPSSMGSPPEPPAKRQYTGILVTIATLLVALVAIGAFMAGRASAPPEDAPTESPGAASVDPGEVPEPVPEPPVSDGTEEPVAAVAASLSPSVVQLETGFGLGSGVIYDSNGLILTAAHVVEGADQVSVILSDGTRLEGFVVGTDPASDIAVVRVNEAGLPAAPLALDGELTVGQMAVAIGSPFGLNGTVTAGVVSAVAEPVPGPDGRIRTMIQTDAPINPGNSGGALANRDGEVIGINDAIFSLSGGNDGIGFAIPIDTALSSAERLVAGEEIRAAFLGIAGTDPDLGRAGALITEVIPDSAAAAAGLQVGDLIVSYNDSPIESFAALAGLVASSQPGDAVALDVVRGVDEFTITATLGDRAEQAP